MSGIGFQSVEVGTQVGSYILPLCNTIVKLFVSHFHGWSQDDIGLGESENLDHQDNVTVHRFVAPIVSIGVS